MKAVLSIQILAEAARQAEKCDTIVSYHFDDFTNVMGFEE